MSRLILSIFTVLAIGTAINAGDLATIRARKEVAYKKLTADVADAIADSKSLAKTDADKARQRLEFMIRTVKDSDAPTETQRATLVQSLQTRLTVVNETARAQKINDDLKPARLPPTKYQYQPVDPPTKGGSYATAKEFITGPKNLVTQYNAIIREREKGNLSLLTGMEKTIPIPGETGIAFPSYWKELSKRHKESVSPKLTKQEQNLLKTLNSTMSVEYDGARFKAVLQHLEEKTGLALIVDPNSERDLNLDYDDPINFKANKATVRTILKSILAQKGLTYIIKEGNLQVMTPKRASEETVIRSYPISDLISPIGGQQMMNPLFGQQVQMMQKAQNAQMLIQIIMMSTDPNYWQPNGPGVILYVPQQEVLLIRASTEMHYQMASPGLFGR